MDNPISDLVNSATAQYLEAQIEAYRRAADILERNLYEISNKSSKPTIAIDFDGVLHAYSRGWEDGVIYDDPTPMSAGALSNLELDYQLIVFTAREDLDPVRKWLKEHYPNNDLKVTNRKPKAKIYIDDRAIRFDGWVNTMEAINIIEREDKRLIHNALDVDNK